MSSVSVTTFLLAHVSQSVRPSRNIPTQSPEDKVETTLRTRPGMENPVTSSHLNSTYSLPMVSAALANKGFLSLWRRHPMTLYHIATWEASRRKRYRTTKDRCRAVRDSPSCAANHGKQVQKSRSKTIPSSNFFGRTRVHHIHRLESSTTVYRELVRSLRINQTRIRHPQKIFRGQMDMSCGTSWNPSHFMLLYPARTHLPRRQHSMTSGVNKATFRRRNGSWRRSTTILRETTRKDDQKPPLWYSATTTAYLEWIRLIRVTITIREQRSPRGPH